jgi:hypothetical protein
MWKLSSILKELCVNWIEILFNLDLIHLDLNSIEDKWDTMTLWLNRHGQVPALWLLSPLIWCIVPASHFFLQNIIISLYMILQTGLVTRHSNHKPKGNKPSIQQGFWLDV